VSGSSAPWFRAGALAWRLAFFVLLILVVIGSLTPSTSDSDPMLPLPDYVQHAIGYGLLMVSLVASQVRPRLWSSALGLVGLGAILEVVQGLLGYRFAELKDLAANALGIAAAGLGALAVQARRRPKPTPSGA
jgi:VanZ family protein